MSAATSSNGVDVLAVLDTAERSLIGAGSTEFRHEFRQARAAIAELIEAARTILDPHTSVSVNEQFANLRAALAALSESQA